MVSVLILGAVLLPALAGVGLIGAALAKAAAWGWRAAISRRPDGGWPVARKMLATGVTLLAFAVLETVGAAVAFYVYVSVVVATDLAQ